MKRLKHFQQQTEPATNKLPWDYVTAREAGLQVDLTSSSPAPNSPYSPTLSSVTTSPHSNKRSYDLHTLQACPANSPVSQARSLSASPVTIKSALLQYPDTSPLLSRTPSTSTSPQTGRNITHRIRLGATFNGRGSHPWSRAPKPTSYHIGQSTGPTQALSGSDSMDYNFGSSKYPTAQSSAEPWGQDSKVWNEQTKSIQKSFNAVLIGNKRQRVD